MHCLPLSLYVENFHNTNKIILKNDFSKNKTYKLYNIASKVDEFVNIEWQHKKT